MSSIWDSLVGQDDIVTSLERAVVDAERRTRGEPGPAMTHAWLFTGPPGSGRSTAAACFAAALVCPEGGCGGCQACRTAPLGGHPDVDMVRPEGAKRASGQVNGLIKLAIKLKLRSFLSLRFVNTLIPISRGDRRVLLDGMWEPSRQHVTLHLRSHYLVQE